MSSEWAQTGGYVPEELSMFVIDEKDEYGTLGGYKTRQEAQVEADRYNREWRKLTPCVVFLLMWPWHRGVKYVVREERRMVMTMEESIAYEEKMEPG